MHSPLCWWPRRPRSSHPSHGEKSSLNLNFQSFIILLSSLPQDELHTITVTAWTGLALWVWRDLGGIVQILNKIFNWGLGYSRWLNFEKIQSWGMNYQYLKTEYQRLGWLWDYLYVNSLPASYPSLLPWRSTGHLIQRVLHEASCKTRVQRCVTTCSCNHSTLTFANAQCYNILAQNNY